MENLLSNQELHHEIFGSILDRTEMTPFLLLPARDYASSLKQATRMMANRGFDTLGSDKLQESERARAAHYIMRAYAYFFDGLFPFATKQLEELVRPTITKCRSLPDMPEGHRCNSNSPAG